MTFWLREAWVDGRLVVGVRVTHAEGVISAVEVGPAHPDDIVLDGVTLPGFANAHSHAFHRALRGRTHHDGGDFWTWRETMYRAATALTPENYRALATAVFAEMVLGGYTVVGEFHYVHRHADGSDAGGAYERALIEAAAAAGIRLTLLDTLYLAGGIDDAGELMPLAPEQRRFSDGSVEAWAQRHATLSEGPTVRIGAAVHSVRAVDAADLPAFAAAIGGIGSTAAAVTAAQPVHAHVSEQPAENAQSRARYGASPVHVLEPLLGPHFTAVHATHLDGADLALLASTGSGVCFCPSTERDLADGLGRAGDLHAAGVPLSIGSDQHVVIDPFDELRQLEGHERLRTGVRGRLDPESLLTAGTAAGYRSLGWTGGTIAVGSVCDLVTIDPASPRTAGAAADQLWVTASAADVRQVVVAGRRVVADGIHELGDIGALLAAAIQEVLP